MKVVCIDNTDFENDLAIGKEYIVLGENFIKTHYVIVNDNDEIVYFNKNKFKIQMQDKDITY